MQTDRAAMLSPSHCLQAAGITIPPNASWTIFAPTNEAFSDDDVREKTGLTAAQLLEPANRQALVQVCDCLCLIQGGKPVK